MYICIIYDWEAELAKQQSSVLHPSHRSSQLSVDLVKPHLCRQDAQAGFDVYIQFTGYEVHELKGVGIQKAFTMKDSVARVRRGSMCPEASHQALQTHFHHEFWNRQSWLLHTSTWPESCSDGTVTTQMAYRIKTCPQWSLAFTCALSSLPLACGRFWLGWGDDVSAEEHALYIQPRGRNGAKYLATTNFRAASAIPWQLELALLDRCTQVPHCSRWR